MTTADRLAQESRYKNRIIFGLLLAICIQGYGWSKTQNQIIVDQPPDPRIFYSNKSGKRTDYTVYGFAALFFPQVHSYINDRENGGQGLINNISRYRYYLTTSYRSLLHKQDKELQPIYKNRTKNVFLSNETIFDDANVEIDGEAWIVWLDVTITEAVSDAKTDKPLYTKRLRYPVRVIQDLTVSKLNNPWRLKLDGNGGREPQVIVKSDSAISDR